MATYSRSLDEIFGLSPQPVAAVRRISARNKSPSPIKSAAESARPTTRHGRSSESSLSGELPQSRVSEVSDRKFDVWSREEQKADGSAESTALLNTLEARRPPVIPEQNDDSASASSSPLVFSGQHETPAIAMQRPSLSTLRSHSSSTQSSNASNLSNQTHDAPPDAEDEKLSASSLSASEEKAGEETIVEPFIQTTSIVSNSLKSNDQGTSDHRVLTRSLKKIKSPEKQTATTFKSQPSQPPTSTAVAKTRRSARASSRPPQPPQRRPNTENTSVAGRRASTDAPRPSTMLRQTTTDGTASYNLWLKRKAKDDEQRRSTERVAAENAERKKVEQQANAAKAYAQWSAEYDRRRAEERNRLKRKKEVEEKKKKAEEEERRKAAEKSFAHWQETEAKRRQTERQQRARSEQKRSESADLTKRKQKSENSRAFRQWTVSSYSRLRDAQNRRSQEEREEQEQKAKERELRDTLAREAYDLWLEMKRKEQGYSHSLAYKILNYDAEAKRRWPTPWIPASQTVARKFVGTGNRRRTLDKPLDIVRRRARSVY